ncbi:MAG TPA: M1 family metallopeptidase [Pyrinomonadaceae bacterium]|nr:M1 family metallopeptidase [Pyrinomonadaceae bacterium]
MTLRQLRERLAQSLLLTVILLTVVGVAICARRERLIDTWKPINYNVSIHLNEGLTEVTSAKTEVALVILKDNVTQIDFDFGTMPITAVTLNGAAVPYERTDGRLNVKPVQPLSRNSNVVVAISYHGKPADGLILSVDKTGKPSAVGDNWPNRVHHWIPSLDHPSAKATVKFSVTAPSRASVVANGRMDQILTTSPTTKTWSFTESVPIPPYCMIIAVGEFAQIVPPQQDITPLAYYVPLPEKHIALSGFGAAYPSLKYFTQTVGEYPYEKLALIVGSTRFGGMENSTAIVFSSTLFDPRRNAPLSRTFQIREGIVSLTAHEIAHQWFGDSVTQSTWSDLWLSEGFATYFAALFIQHTDGEEAFRNYMANAGRTYLGSTGSVGIPLHDTETENLMALLNANNYQKGAWILHMLRAELGDKHFFDGVKEYYKTHKNATANSEDLRIALEKVSGKNLKPFFTSWVYGAGHPKYHLTWRWNRRRRTARLILRQTQTQPAFANTVTVTITTARGRQVVTLKPVTKETRYDVRLSAAPTAMEIDPENIVLKEVLDRN